MLPIMAETLEAKTVNRWKRVRNVVQLKLTPEDEVEPATRFRRMSALIASIKEQRAKQKGGKRLQTVEGGRIDGGSSSGGGAMGVLGSTF